MTVCEHYEPNRHNCISTLEITKKMDVCISLMAEICSLVCKEKKLLKRRLMMNWKKGG